MEERIEKTTLTRGPMVAGIPLGAQRSARFAFKRNVEKGLGGAT
jgi:hypothetical protein